MKRGRCTEVALLAGLSVLGLGPVPVLGKAPPTIEIAVERPAAHREVGDSVVFDLAVRQNGEALPEAPCTVTLRRDFGAVLRSEEVRTPAALTATRDTPGFLFCEVRYQPAAGAAVTASRAVAFAPERIQPAAPEPEDFDAFWAAGRERLAAIPTDAQTTPLEGRYDRLSDTFKISLANVDGTRVWAFLSVPRHRDGPFPLLVTVPGANLHAPSGPDTGWAGQGVMELTISVHAHDPGLSREQFAAYAEKAKLGNYTHYGAPDRERYYYRRAILGADRMIDYVCENYPWDGTHCVVSGGSQGGAFAYFMAGFNRRVTACASSKTALCDHLGSLAGRRPGWPGLVGHVEPGAASPLAAMAGYFDAVFFARRIRVPTLASVGWMDGTCPPAGVYAAYNQIPGPKRMFDEPRRGHDFGYPKVEDSAPGKTMATRRREIDKTLETLAVDNTAMQHVQSQIQALDREAEALLAAMRKRAGENPEYRAEGARVEELRKRFLALNADTQAEPAAVNAAKTAWQKLHYHHHYAAHRLFPDDAGRHTMLQVRAQNLRNRRFHLALTERTEHPALAAPIAAYREAAAALPPADYGRFHGRWLQGMLGLAEPVEPRQAQAADTQGGM